MVRKLAGIGKNSWKSKSATSRFYRRLSGYQWNAQNYLRWLRNQRF